MVDKERQNLIVLSSPSKPAKFTKYRLPRRNTSIYKALQTMIFEMGITRVGTVPEKTALTVHKQSVRINIKERS